PRGSLLRQLNHSLELRTVGRACALSLVDKFINDVPATLGCVLTHGLQLRGNREILLGLAFRRDASIEHNLHSRRILRVRAVCCHAAPARGGRRGTGSARREPSRILPWSLAVAPCPAR